LCEEEEFWGQESAGGVDLGWGRLRDPAQSCLRCEELGEGSEGDVDLLGGSAGLLGGVEGIQEVLDDGVGVLAGGRWVSLPYLKWYVARQTF